MNANDLRHLLFGINNEQMTVKELRAVLFLVKNQEEDEVTPNLINALEQLKNE